MKFGLIALFGVLALSGCGNNNNDNYDGGYYQGGGAQAVQGYCAPEVVDAYNNFAVSCGTIQSDFDVQRCRMTAQGFVHLYTGISCVAVPPQGGFGQGPWDNNFFNQYQGQQVFHVTDQPMQQVLAMLGDFRAGDQQWQGRHRRWPRVGQRNGGQPGFPGQPGPGFPGRR